MEQHLVEPLHGRIHREWLAEESNEYHLVVEERMEDATWMVVYEWDAGWDAVASFRMGFREEYEGAISSRLARIVEVGESTFDDQDAILVIEQGRDGFWLVLYDWLLSWEVWDLRMVYFVSGYGYAYPLVDGWRNDDEVDDGSGSEGVQGALLLREDTPSLSDQDYQDLDA